MCIATEISPLMKLGELLARHHTHFYIKLSCMHGAVTCIIVATLYEGFFFNLLSLEIKTDVHVLLCCLFLYPPFVKHGMK